MFHKVHPSLRNSVAMLFLLSSLFVASATGATASQDRWQADRIIFEGRIVGVQIVPKRDDRQLPIDDIFVLQYQFAIDRHFATMAVSKEIGLNEINLEAAKMFRFQLALTREQVDLTQLTEEHLLNELEKALPAGLHIGQPCLVVVQYAPTWGQYIETILPATEANRKAFLEEHHEYCLRYRRQYQTSPIRYLMQRHVKLIAVIHSTILDILKFRENGDPQSIEQLESRLDDRLRNLYADYSYNRDRIKETIQELERQIGASDDQLFKEIFQEMIRDLDGRLENIKKTRRKELDFNKHVLGVRVPEIKEYQELVNRTNPDILSELDDP